MIVLFLLLFYLLDSAIVKRLFILPVLSVLLLSCGKSTTSEPSISGTVTGIPDGTVIVLTQGISDSYEIFVADTLRNGKFSFMIDSLGSAEKVYLTISGKYSKKFLPVWIAAGTTTRITGKNQLISAWDVMSDIPEQSESNLYAVHTKDLLSKAWEIENRLEDIFSKKISTSDERERRDAETAKLYDDLDGIKLDIAEAELAVMANQEEITPQWVEKLKEAALSVYYTEISHPERARQLRETAVTQYSRIASFEPATPRMRLIEARLFPKEKVEVGDIFADMRTYRIDGRADYLANYMDEKYLLIDCWNKGCGSCIQIMPLIDSLKVRYPNDLTVVYLDFFDTKENWIAASEKHGIGENNLWSYYDQKGEGGLSSKFSLRGNPWFILISPEGEITFSNFSPVDENRYLSDWAKNHIK